MGNGLQEKDINLDVALRTRDMLELDSTTVIMTRTTDVYVSLQGRCDIANNNGAHRFISSHCNAFGDPATHGTETYCHPYGSSNSYDMRNRINAEMVSHMGTYNRGTKTADFYVLRNTNMPAALAEVAFISNSGDAAKGQADDTLLAIDNTIVTADFTDNFYIEESSRTSGIRVEASSPLEGTEVSVAGRLSTVGGERVIEDATVFLDGAPGAPKPLLLSNENLGGGALNVYTPGVTGAPGLNNIGTLVTTTGRVIHEDVGSCYIDDGSDIQDGSGYTGLKIDTTTLTGSPTENQYVKVTGISSVELAGSDLIRLLRPRRDADVIVYP